MTKTLYVVLGSLSVFLFAQSAAASMIVYESLPTSPSPHVSRHGVNGPVLADDFMSAFTGTVKGIEWWGAAPLTGSTDQFEVTFHTDAGGLPAATAPSGGVSQHFVTATGVNIGGGLFHYTADWNPADMFVAANTSYWFSVANASGSTWTWANGAFPTIGAEFFDAVVSTGVGPNGGPHFGPWNGITDTDFAFRILVPEPAIVGLIVIGLLAAGFAGRRRQRS